MLIPFDTFLYYGDADTFTVNANPCDSIDGALRNAQALAGKLGADGFALYDPRQDSNGHFPGPCIKTVHGYGTQVHRPEDIPAVGRWVLSHK